MTKIEIYTTRICPYCVRAKALLERKNLTYQEINVEEVSARKKMMERANGMRTVPQIFINDQHIGGCDDLYKIDQQGELDKLLKI